MGKKARLRQERLAEKLLRIRNYLGLSQSEMLKKLGFEKEANGDGSVKYKKGAFRILISKKDNFNDFEMWYREDKRHLKGPIFVHELQNHHLQMTKVELTRAAA